MSLNGMRSHDAHLYNDIPGVCWSRTGHESSQDGISSKYITILVLLSNLCVWEYYQLSNLINDHHNIDTGYDMMKLSLYWYILEGQMLVI